MKGRSINNLFKNETKWMLLVLVAPPIVGFLILLVYPLVEPVTCYVSGGKWTSSASTCIPKNCASDNSCVGSYNNISTCKAFRTGVSKAELYFAIGMPINQNGNLYTFSGGAGEEDIHAVIVNEKVESLQCGG